MAKILILIVEDEASLAQMYTMKLQASGFNVDVAHDGEAGFEKMKVDHPDMVLMDIMMPGLNGIEAVKKAKADDETKNIPIVMLTNFSGSHDINSAMKAGAIDYIVKSDMTPEEVLAKIKAIISISQSPTKAKPA